MAAPRRIESGQIQYLTSSSFLVTYSSIWRSQLALDCKDAIRNSSDSHRCISRFCYEFLITLSVHLKNRGRFGVKAVGVGSSREEKVESQCREIER